VKAEAARLALVKYLTGAGWSPIAPGPDAGLYRNPALGMLPVPKARVTTVERDRASLVFLDSTLARLAELERRPVADLRRDVLGLEV
jgi:hypothetical protein